MRAWAIDGQFGFENLRCLERPEPEPGPGEVLVKVEAVGLNYRDLLVVEGLYNPKLPLPRVIGSDVAGEVVAAGPGVRRFSGGEPVVCNFMPRWRAGPIDDHALSSALGGSADGVLAEKVVLPAVGLLPLPEGLSFSEASTLPCAAVTAWHALAEAHPQAGESVLIQGTGGVSVFALQFAKALGLRPLIISSSDAKLERAQALGAAAGLNYRTNPDWPKWCRDQTGGLGVDHVVEVGGAGTLERSFKAVRQGGHVALIGVLSGTGTINPLPILMRSLRVRGIYVGSRQMFEAMNRCVEYHHIRPVIDHEYDFGQVPDALLALKNAGHFGKIVVRGA